jgi:hypothetical protein
VGDHRIHIHEPRLGEGIPAKTVRPFPRLGDAALGAFREALATSAGEVVLTGRVFHRSEPPAHLVDRVVSTLRGCVESGRTVRVPADTPRALLFLAAGVRLDGPDADGDLPAFHRTGAFRVREGERFRTERVVLPRPCLRRVDVRGLSAADALAKIDRSLRRIRGSRFVRLLLAGETDEPELLGFGPRELLHHLPGGMDGAVENRTRPRRPRPVAPADEDARLKALRTVRESLPEAPAATGVYEFLDGAGRVLYVGKAIDLRRRIASHFTAEAREPTPREGMLLAARGLRFRETPSEVEALLLELDRIREERPPYNRQMREPEAARYLRAGLDDPFPALASAREVVEDGATWIGPFTKRWALERALRVTAVAFGLGGCTWRPGAEPPRACSDRELGICAAPCVGRISLDRYRERVAAALDHLLGRDGPEPRFGELNGPSAGLLEREDLRVFTSFRRGLQWLVRTLREADGGLPLSGGRILLILGGQRAGERTFADGAEGLAWVRERVDLHRRLPAPTFVPPDRVGEVRILSRALRSAGKPWYQSGP